MYNIIDNDQVINIKILFLSEKIFGAGLFNETPIQTIFYG